MDDINTGPFDAYKEYWKEQRRLDEEMRPPEAQIDLQEVVVSSAISKYYSRANDTSYFESFTYRNDFNTVVFLTRDGVLDEKRYPSDGIDDCPPESSKLCRFTARSLSNGIHSIATDWKLENIYDLDLTTLYYKDTLKLIGIGTHETNSDLTEMMAIIDGSNTFKTTFKNDEDYYWSEEEEISQYEDYGDGGAFGFDEETIEGLFEGDPDNTWNVD